MSMQYLRSERAHFMCPMMHFGMVLKMDCPCVPEKAERTLDTLAQAHPFLRANIGYDRMHIPYYEIREHSRTELFVRDTPDTLREDYAGIRRDLPRGGLLKVFLYPDGSGTTVLLTAHHLLTDGVGLKSLAAEFTQAAAANALSFIYRNSSRSSQRKARFASTAFLSRRSAAAASA